MRKAQMFVVTLIFMAQFVFAVQQVLLRYSAVDLPAQPAQREAALLAAAVRTVNESVGSAPDCGGAQAAFQELAGFYQWDRPMGAFTVSVSGVWDCAQWEASSGTAPLTAAVVVSGPQREARLIAGFYRD